MSNKAKAILIAGLACAFLCGCSGGSAGKPTIGQADSITLHEGLPHPMYEPKALAEEKAAKPTAELHGFPFYLRALDLKPGDGEKLKAIFADPRTFEADSGEKKCGGFHPDYAVGWTIGDQDYAELICFGCGEIRRYGPAVEVKHDLSADGKKRLEAILKPYRKNRPEPKAGP